MDEEKGQECLLHLKKFLVHGLLDMRRQIQPINFLCYKHCEDCFVDAFRLSLILSVYVAETAVVCHASFNAVIEKRDLNNERNTSLFQLLEISNTCSYTSCVEYQLQ